MTMSIARRLRFGAFELDLHDRELRRNGLRVRLQEQPFQVLALLLERPGDLVKRERLARSRCSLHPSLAGISMRRKRFSRSISNFPRTGTIRVSSWPRLVTETTDTFDSCRPSRAALLSKRLPRHGATLCARTSFDRRRPVCAPRPPAAAVCPPAPRPRRAVSAGRFVSGTCVAGVCNEDVCVVDGCGVRVTAAEVSGAVRG